MEKSTKYIIGAFLLTLVIMFFMKGDITGNVVAVGTQNFGEYTGNVVAMDPDRPMAGSKCHVMGGQVMGDCQVREIDLIATQWDWSEPTITVKSGEYVKINAISKDVAHGISIPQLGFNLIIRPGRTTTGGFIAPAPGEYSYGCSVMCGQGHRNHKGTLIVTA